MSREMLSALYMWQERHKGSDDWELYRVPKSRHFYESYRENRAQNNCEIYYLDVMIFTK